MRLCAAQLRPVAGDIAANTARHLQLLELGVAHGADLVFYPELSLTGYEPRLAKLLATAKEDCRLDVFQGRSDAHGVIVGVGVPLSTGALVQIGMVWFAPHAPRLAYAKQQLHDDELPYFVPGGGQLVLDAGPHRLAPAICYESLQLGHAAAAADLGADIYLASVAKPANALARALLHYPAIARRHNMYVIMADCVGPSDNFVSVGRSAVWSRSGELLAQLDGEAEGIVMVDTVSAKAGTHVLPAA